jgi:hypothetical protein
MDRLHGRFWRRVRAGSGLLAALLLVSGCSSLLPRSQSEARGTWTTFDQAKAAIEKIQPGGTTRAELNAAGIDPYKTANITVLTYSDILLRFPVTAALSMEQLDEGLQACFKAGKKCDGYLVQAREAKRRRTGNFFLDSLHFDRPVETHGWSFNALIILVEDVVVYTLYGGQPLITEHERERNPLGPLQGWGDAVPSLVGW